MSIIKILTAIVFWAHHAQAQDTRFFGRCEVSGAYGQGCVEFYDGSWTESQMIQICQSVAARKSSIEINAESKCLRDNFASLCVSQQLFSRALIYIDHMDRFSCQALLNGKLYQRPTVGW